jgi:adenylate cyclase
MGKKSASGAEQIPNNPTEVVRAATGKTETVVSNPAPPGHGRRHPHIEFTFLEELKHRNVVRVAILYLVVCWLILEPTHVVFHMLEVPAWANRLVLILMAIGLPAVVLFAWAFEITPEGLKPTVEVDPKKSIRALTGRRLDRAIIVVLVLALAYFVADKFWLAKHQAVTEPGVTTEVPGGPPSASAALAAPEKSIAVLPFVDMSERHDQEYFSDGLSEEVLDLLSRTPELHVVARTSAFSFKGKSDDIPTIARKLMVANVLEGSVRRSGNTLRITVQLVRADNGYHLWSQTYDRKLDDIFKVQDEIAGSVVQALKVSLLADAMPKAAAARNTGAYTLFLQARSMYFRASTQADYEKVVDYLKRAINSDLTFAPTWTLLSRAQSRLAQAYVHSPQEWDEARRAAGQALALDPKLPDAHNAMAAINVFHDWDWVGGQAHLQQALALDPGSAGALGLAGVVALWMGDTDQALKLLQRGAASDPVNDVTYHNLAWALLSAGKLDEALVAVRKRLDLNPTGLWSHWVAGQVMLEKGQPVESLVEFELENDEAFRLSGRAFAYHALGREAESDAALADLERRYAEKWAYQIAQVHAHRGEIDQGFAWLDRAYQQREFACPNVKIDPLLKKLRPDPRYKAFLRKMKLPE